jgi:hypothetical protein
VFVSYGDGARLTLLSLTHRRKIQMLRRRARELTSVRKSLVDTMAAS